MKTLSTLLLLVSVSLSFGQSQRFEPTWEVGDKYELSITTITQNWENEEMEETTEFIDPTITVTDMDSESYTLSLAYKDVMQSKLLELSEKYDWDMDPVDLELFYRLKKSDGSYELQNYEEAKAFMKDAFEDISRGFASMSDDDDDMAGLLFTLAMAPIEQLFESKAVMSSHFGGVLDDILMPFYKDLSIGEDLTITESDENPFSPGDTLSVTLTYSLMEYEPKGERAVVKSTAELDFTPYMEMLKPMIEGMVRGFAQIDTSASQAKIDSTMTEINKVFDAMHMDGDIESSITFNPKTGWPISMTTHSDFEMRMGELENGRVIATKTTEIRKL